MRQCERALLSSLRQEATLNAMSGTDKSHRRPGILVLINDADWELEGEDHYELKDHDNVLFVSTLHGG